MRLPLRPAIAVFVTMAAAVGLVTCMDSPTAPKRGAVAGLAHLSLVPVFSAEAQAAYANLADFDISFNNVTVHVVHQGDPPELFQAGLPVVLEGRWQGDVFASDRILVKHSEEYKASNPDRVDSSAP